MHPVSKAHWTFRCREKSALNKNANMHVHVKKCTSMLGTQLTMDDAIWRVVMIFLWRWALEENTNLKNCSPRVKKRSTEKPNRPFFRAHSFEGARAWAHVHQVLRGKGRFEKSPDTRWQCRHRCVLRYSQNTATARCPLVVGAPQGTLARTPKRVKTKIAWPEKRTTENAIYENIFRVKAIL